MPWTGFMDMHSGGGTKEAPHEYIYIEAPEDEAKVIFYNRFGHNPERVTCTCCGEDYLISESPTLRQATAFERRCSTLEIPRGKDGRYQKPDDPWFSEHYYLEPDEEDEARRRGWTVKPHMYRSLANHPYLTVEQYVEGDDVLLVPAEDIQDAERTGDVPEQGYVWAG